MINVNVNGFQMGQTVYRLMYCAQNNVDITKLPKDTCIAMRNGVAMVTSREEMNHERFTSKKTQKNNFEKWKRNTDLLTKYYQGDTKLCWAAAAANALVWTGWNQALAQARGTPVMDEETLYLYFKVFSPKGMTNQGWSAIEAIAWILEWIRIWF